MKKFLLCLFFLISTIAHAQDGTTISSNGWYVGAGVGLHYGGMSFSDLDDKRFPTHKWMSSPAFSLFLQKEFGGKMQFAIRPELSFLKRGGSIQDIERYKGYANPNIDDVFYKVKAHYLDIRVPLLYQFGGLNSSVRPYLGITPILGIPIGGNIRLQEDYKDMSYVGYKVDLNQSNFSSTYFAIAPTVGVRFNFHTGKYAQNQLFVGLEASYEIGLSDTYGSDEKDGKAIDVVNGSKFKFDGSRKFSGLEFKLTIGIPFSAFKRSQPVIKRSTYVPPTRVVENEKPCYTLDEITSMMARNVNVLGKTICAVDDINFDFGKSEIKEESFAYLNKLAETLKLMNTAILVKGHTDNVGTDEFNLKLSKKRAEAVVKYLKKRGVRSDLLSYEYYGSTSPVKDNSTEEGRTFNRRVEFEILK